MWLCGSGQRISSDPIKSCLLRVLLSHIGKVHSFYQKTYSASDMVYHARHLHTIISFEFFWKDELSHKMSKFSRGWCRKKTCWRTVCKVNWGRRIIPMQLARSRDSMQVSLQLQKPHGRKWNGQEDVCHITPASIAEKTHQRIRERIRYIYSLCMFPHWKVTVPQKTFGSLLNSFPD